MLLSELLEKEISALVDQFESLWPGYWEEDNPVPPHRQRTTVNRFSGYAMFLGLGRKKCPGMKGLRAWQKRLGPVRDLDVVRGWTAKAHKAAGEGAAAAAEALQENLTGRRAALMEGVRPDAAGLPGANARVALQEARGQLLTAVERLREQPEEFDRLAAFEAVRQPWEEALRTLEDRPVEDALHAFRVRNKRLRFVLDILAAEEKEAGTGGRTLRNAARFAARTHTTLGNLSDLWMLRDELRLARQRWQGEKRGLEESARALEAGRAGLEAGEFDGWFRDWPTLANRQRLARVKTRLAEPPQPSEEAVALHETTDGGERT